MSQSSALATKPRKPLPWNWEWKLVPYLHWNKGKRESTTEIEQQNKECIWTLEEKEASVNIGSGHHQMTRNERESKKRLPRKNMKYFSKPNSAAKISSKELIPGQIPPL